MVIHTHHSSNPFSGEMKRIYNIDRDVAAYISDTIIEVEFFSIRSIVYVLTKGKFKLSNNVIKKYYIPNLERIGIINKIWCSIVVSLLIIKYKPSSYIEEWKLPLGIKLITCFFSKKTKIILDIHGAVTEELSYIGKYSKKIEKEELRSIYSADTIICQSDEMKKYLIKKYKISSSKIIVFRCGVDCKFFSYNLNIRNNMRHKLSINDNEIVFVYSGGMHKWQKIDETLLYFKKFHNTIVNSKLLIITKDTEELNRILVENSLQDITESIIIKSLSYNEVSNYLCAADVALLLRDNVTMNSVASPTKLAEYLRCGLPVLSTDVAYRWIKEDGHKYILNINDITIQTICEYVLHVNKDEISHFAKDHLSLEIDRLNVKKYFNTYEHIS